MAIYARTDDRCIIYRNYLQKISNWRETFLCTWTMHFNFGLEVVQWSSKNAWHGFNRVSVLAWLILLMVQITDLSDNSVARHLLRFFENFKVVATD